MFPQVRAPLKGYELTALDPLGDECVHLITECTKLGMADRDAATPRFMQG